VNERNFIGLSDGSPMQEYLDEQAVLSGLTLDFRARVRTFDGICCMAEYGAGVGIVPLTAAKRYKGALGIRTVSLTDRWAKRQLVLCVRAADQLQRSEKALLDHLTAHGEAREG
jgi:DNA-binding transcriptional LysR family regulator